MAVFLCVTAAVAVVIGLVGLVAGHMRWGTGHKEALRACVASWSSGADEGSRA